MQGRMAVAISALALMLAGIVISLDRPYWTALQSGSRSRPAPRIIVSRDSEVISNEQWLQIESLIDRLSEIDQPDYGFAPWMSGVRFGPVKDSATFQMGVIMIDHGLTSNECLEQLVAIGPKALPQLLRRLTDSTPTRLDVQSDFGVQLFGHEVHLNKDHPIEKAIFQKHQTFFTRESSTDRIVPRYTVTVGDICFVIVGQIVNREYQSLRYQPTACRVINSPTHSPEIAAIVREVWSSEHPTKRLLDSLLQDLSNMGGDWHSGAVMRLLYYFPKETEEMIARRIERMPVMAVDEEQYHNLPNAGDYIDIAGVRNCNSPRITKALLRVIRDTDNPYLFAEAMTEGVVKADPELVVQRLRKILSVRPADQGPFGGEYDTLVAAAKYLPDQSSELFAIYRGHNSLDTTRSAIEALRRPAAPRDWMIAFLVSRLDDKTDTGGHYGPENDRQPIRICDEAASVLANDYLTDSHFELKGSRADLDREIETLKQSLKRNQ